MILHVITSLENGGAEALLLTLIKADTSNDHAVVCLHREGFYGPVLREMGVDVRIMGMPRGKITLGGLRILFRAIRELDPEIIQGWMFHANLLAGVAARLLGKNRVVWGLHNTAMVGSGVSWSTNLVNRLCAVLSKFVPRHVVHSSRSGASEHVELGYAKNKMSVIPGGYNLDKFKPDSTARSEHRGRLAAKDTDVVIGLFARWHPQKDHDNLIHAIAKLPANQRSKTVVALMGNDISETNTELMDCLNKHSVLDNFRLVGPVANAPDYMNALDMHVLPSAYGESFPNVVNESMACGIPCIVTDVADSSVIVGDVGIVVPPREPQMLADAISLYMNEMGSDAWSQRKKSSRQRIIENFSVDSLVRQYNEVWAPYRNA